MTVVDTVEALGGVASWATLRRRATRREIERAVAAGEIVAEGRGRYALPAADESIRAAVRLGGVVSGARAALSHGWAVARLPKRIEVTVPKHRRPVRVPGVQIRWVDLGDDEIDGLVTSRARTLTDCLRRLPFDEALAVADSALRSADVSAEELQRLAGRVRGPGARQVRWAARHASARAANPFESVLRALAIEAGLQVRPQVPIFGDRFLGSPDLVDEERRAILEADSFAWHGSRRALRRDARRYNAFVCQGWRVLRFSWEDVLHDQDHVREVLESAAQGWTNGRCRSCGAA